MKFKILSKWLVLLSVMMTVLAGCGGGGAESSTPTVQQTLEVANALDVGRTVVEKAIDVGDATDALQNAINAVKSQPGISNAYLSSDSTTIIVEHNSGEIGYIITSTATMSWTETSLTVQAKQALRASNTTESLPFQKGTQNLAQIAATATSKKPISQSIKTAAAIVPKNKRAAFFIPFQEPLTEKEIEEYKDEDIYFYSNYDKIRSDLITAGYSINNTPSNDIYHYADAMANLDGLFEILQNDYDIINIATHGHIGKQGKIVFTTREPWNNDKDFYKNKYTKIYGPEVGFIISNAVSRATIVNDGIQYLAFNSDLLSGLAVEEKQRFKCRDALIVANACHSLQNDTMQSAFKSLGASKYLGYTDSVAIELINSFTPLFYKNIAAGTTVDGAIANVKKDTWFRFVQWLNEYNGYASIKLLAVAGSTDDFYLVPPVVNNLSGTYYGTWLNNTFNGSGEHRVVINRYSATSISGTLEDVTSGFGASSIDSGYIIGNSFYAEVQDGAGSTLAFVGMFSADGSQLFGDWYAMAGGSRTDYGTWAVTKQ